MTLPGEHPESDRGPREIKVDREHPRVRLDQFLAARLPSSRSQIARMIKAGLVTVNGVAARAASIVRGGDRIDLAPAPIVPLPPRAGSAPQIEVLFADNELIAVNKPPGMVVHQAPGHSDSTLVNALLARFPELAAMADPDGIARPGIVHRLDKDTSGVMVVARTPFARTALARQFKERTVRKIYLAMVRGIIVRDRVVIARPLGRHPTERKRMSVRSRAPRDAVSHVAVLARFRERHARARASRDRQDPSDSRPSRFDRPSVPGRFALRRRARRRYAGESIRAIPTPGAARAGAAGEPSSHRRAP